MSEYIRIQPVDETWQTLGRGTFIRATPSGISPTWNSHGPDTLGFEIPVDAIRSTLELREFTPVEYYVGGNNPLWSGYIFDAPRRTAGGDTGVSVSCRGWQYHAEDDAHASVYVHRNIGDWKDTRSYPSNPTQLTRFVASPQVITDSGAVALQWSKGTPVDINQIVGITLDQGPDPDGWCLAYDIEAEAIGGGVTVNNTFYFRCSDSIETIVSTGIFGTDRHDPINAATSIPGGNHWAGTLNAGGQPRRRYLTLMFVRAGASIALWGSDDGIRILEVILYRDGAYQSSGNSVLTATQVFVAETARCLLLSTDTSQISQTSFGIPALGTFAEDATPTDMMTRADSYHRFRWGVDASRRTFFQPQASVAELQVNTRDPGVDYKDASHNAGTDVYNKVIVQGQKGDGTPLRVIRYATQGTAVDYQVPAGITIPNPSFDTNTTGWVNFYGTTSTITRDTGVFDTSPASGRLDVATTGTGDIVNLRHAITGTFLAGFSYRITVRLRRGATTGGQSSFSPTFGDIAGGDYGYGLVEFYDTIPSASFVTRTVLWTPTKNTTAAAFNLLVINKTAATALIVYVDSLTIEQGVATMPDRRGFLRSKSLDVQAPTTEAAMALLGDLFLAQHKRPPFKGSLDLSAPAVRDVLAGRDLEPHEVASRCGELVRLADVVDPYTGSRGRDAVMVSAQVSNGGGSASISLDNDRASFEALMSRMGVVQPSRQGHARFKPGRK